MEKTNAPTVELADLVGDGELSGVSESVMRVKRYADYYADANAMSFILNGVTYSAIEDPSDGYRSHLREIQIGGEVNNTFAPIRVLGRLRNRSQYSACEILEFIDRVTGKTVLEIGTGNTNDYYPYFVATFSPENMAINQLGMLDAPAHKAQPRKG